MNKRRIGSIFLRAGIYLTSSLGLVGLLLAAKATYAAEQRWSGFTLAAAYLLGAATVGLANGVTEYYGLKKIEDDASKGGSSS